MAPCCINISRMSFKSIIPFHDSKFETKIENNLKKITIDGRFN